MHVNAKRVVVLGLLIAFSVLLVILSGIIEINTLFLLALSSFGVGIAIREYGLAMGVGYTIGSFALSFLLAGNKIYVLTFLAMCIYLLLSETAFVLITKMKLSIRFYWIFIVSKYILFNLIYIPVLLLLPKVIYSGVTDTKIWIMLLLAGQVALYIYDTAFHYFQNKVWGKYRHKLGIGN